MTISKRPQATRQSVKRWRRMIGQLLPPKRLVFALTLLARQHLRKLREERHCLVGSGFVFKGVENVRAAGAQHDQIALPTLGAHEAGHVTDQRPPSGGARDRTGSAVTLTPADSARGRARRRRAQRIGLGSRREATPGDGRGYNP